MAEEKKKEQKDKPPKPSKTAKPPKPNDEDGSKWSALRQNGRL